MPNQIFENRTERARSRKRNRPHFFLCVLQVKLAGHAASWIGFEYCRLAARMIAEAAVPDKFVVTELRRLNDETCRKLGSGWVASRRSLALKVPSVVVEDEWNVLLNPRHPKFAQVEIAGAKPFRYDERMFR